MPADGSMNDDGLFKPFSAEFAADPYATYEKLRAQDGLYYYAEADMWLASRYDDVRAIVTSPKMLRTLRDQQSLEEEEAAKRSNNFHHMPSHERYVQYSILDSEGEDHQRLRKVAFKLFTSANIKKQRAAAEAFIAERMAEMLEAGTVDFIECMASRVPGFTIGRLLGVPDSDASQLHEWSERVVRYFEVDRNDANKAAAEEATSQFADYLLDLRRTRKGVSRDDLFTVLVAAEQARDISDDEFISTCMLMLMAGHGSTQDVLGTGLLTLLTHRDEMARLDLDRSLMATAAQEMFRFEPPLPLFHRYASDDTELNGQHFAEETKFGLLYGSANRDPAAFPNPDRFDVGRTPNRHMAFGSGIHTCMGNHLARQNMEIVFSTLFDTSQSIELVEPEPDFKRSASVRGLTRLPIELVRK